ncbi:cellulose synthase-like protein H1 isoform X3 [Prosopis cineraria]|uniref:cellulose synthase-like protein H1 isoform X3 n=1 Tax=Prosopis cineraria TaxID=364024 RepID=UPI00240F7B6A|nr:cellulose synthase-like protein H1 isoform X3 [Prosopis cineraria]
MEEVQLYEKIRLRRTFQRVMDGSIFLLLLLLLSHRLISFSTHFTFPCFLAFLCESWFTFNWFMILSTKWSPARINTFLHPLSLQVPELPAVDLLVTTADPVLEPPIITVNTVLSLLALDYPPQKLACYVSDDGCSPVTFYALVEAFRFAQLWVPFCRKYNVQLRAPLRFFSDEPTGGQHSPEFTQDSLRMKEEYEKLSRKIEDASTKSEQIELREGFVAFMNAERRNHPPIIMVIWENKEGQSDGLPNLIYISREKKPLHPHHHKAGAMNVLTRVSGLMSNAPYMLNVDCDMMVNNPKIVQHAMCILLDPRAHREVAFVRCFQQFYDGFKDDPFGNQFVAAFMYLMVGVAGLQGPFYCGTNCFHRRQVIYGCYPRDTQRQNQERLLDKELEQKFGSSKEFVKQAARAWEDNTCSSSSNVITPSTILEASILVSSCDYEYGTAWGKQVGWLYGSLAEDQQTGLNIHRSGWRSECCTPDPIAFTGCAPGGLVSSMVQQKRWACGLPTVLLGPQSPYLGLLFGKIEFRQCLAYLWLIHWGFHGFPEICYAALPAYCLITNSTFLPEDHFLWIYMSIFVIHNIYNLIEYVAIGLSIRTWWNNHRMRRITAMNAWFVGSLSGILNMLGNFEATFEVTQKEPPTSGSGTDKGRFTFDENLVFVPGTTVLFVQVTALVMKLQRLGAAEKSGNGSGAGEVLCSVYLVVCFLPFLKGLFGKAPHGIPLSTIFKSAILAILFIHCSRSSITASMV